MSLPHRLKDGFERSWPAASLRTYLFAVMLVATLPMALLTSLQVFNDVRSDQDRLEGELARSASAFALSVQRQLASSIDGLGVLSRSELFQQGRIAALGRLLHGRPRRDWDSVFLMDRDGSMVLDTGAHPATPAELRELHELQRRVLRERGPAVSGLGDDRRPGSRAVAVALPVLQNGGPRYLLGARMGEAVWQRLAETAGTPTGGHAALFDAQDRLIGTSQAPVAPPGAVLPRDAAQAMQGRPGGPLHTSDVDGHEVYASWREVPLAGWRAWVALPAAPIDAAHRRTLGAALSTAGASLLLGLLLAALVARRVTRPLRQLARGGANALPGPVAVREIALLRDALRPAPAPDTAAQDAQPAAAAAGGEVEAANRAREEVLAMLGHELRTPLGAIAAAVDVLDAVPPDGPVAAEARAIVARQSRKLVQMLNELPEAGRVMSGTIALRREPFDLADLVRRVAEPFTLAGDAGHHPLQLALQPAWVNGDAVRVEQVAAHLLAHTIHSAPAGRTIQVRVAQEHDWAVLDVRDMAAGVAPARPPHGSDPDIEEEQPRDRRAGGAGIGLTLVRCLVELHGGMVAFDSSDEGLRFTVRLPAAASPDARSRGVTPRRMPGRE